MRLLKDIVYDFLNTDFARNGCTDETICDLITEMDEHTGSYVPNISCETCCKCGETICGNDTKSLRCWESIK